MLDGPEAKFKIDVKQGVVELEGSENFVDKHLDKFEEIFKSAIKQTMAQGIIHSLTDDNVLTLQQQNSEKKLGISKHELVKANNTNNNNNKHATKQSLSLPPIPVDLKANVNKVGLREFYAEKKPANHYEKTVVFVYYLTKINKETEVKYGEILSCYEEVDEKKPSIIDIIKNSVRYKGWLEQGSGKFITRLTISGENFVKFDLPQQKKIGSEQPTILFHSS
ncbi:MAG: hypothetical protein ACJ706_11560 [Nitrososphaeraceae archaeon]